MALTPAESGLYHPKTLYFVTETGASTNFLYFFAMIIVNISPKLGIRLNHFIKEFLVDIVTFIDLHFMPIAFVSQCSK